MSTRLSFSLWKMGVYLFHSDLLSASCVSSVVLVAGRTKPAVSASLEAVKTAEDRLLQKICPLPTAEEGAARGLSSPRISHLEASLDDPYLPAHLCLSVPSQPGFT